MRPLDLLPAQSVLEIARRLVVRTNDWPGLRGLYREAYERGVSLAARRLASVPGVLAVLLRVSREGRTWVPGLSDYDLTVLADRCDPAPMSRFLDALWTRYRQLKRTLPQLGEMEVLNVDEYADALRFGPLPLSSLKRLETLFVRPDHPGLDRLLQHAPRAVGNREILLDALSRYVRFLFPSWLHGALGASNLARRRTEHLLVNVRQRLQQLDPSVPTPRTKSLADDLLRVFEDLTRACGRITRGVDEATGGFCPRSRDAPEDALALIEAFASDALRQAPVSDCSVVLWISFLSVDKLNLAFVVPDDTPLPDVRRLVATLATYHGETQTTWKTRFTNGDLQPYFPCLSHPVLFSRSMWACWHELSPFDGVAIAATGRTLMGPADVMPGVPSLAALRRGAEVHYVAMLSLKNNWRPLRGPGPPHLYGTMVNHVKAYGSAITGRVLTSPVDYDFRSVSEGYQAVANELTVLRRRLPE